MVKPYIQKLGKDGIAWVRESLGHTAAFDNNETLSRDVLSKTNFDNGEVFIVVATAEHHDAVTNSQPLKNWGFPVYRSSWFSWIKEIF